MKRQPPARASVSTSAPAPASLASQALALHRAGRLDEAEKLYRAVLRKAPNAATALNGLGSIARHRGEQVSAYRLFRRAVSANPAFALAHHNLAALLHSGGHHAAALAAARKAVAIDAQATETFRLLGDIYAAGRRPALAIAAFERVIELDPDDALARASIVSARRAECDWREFEDDDRRIRQAARDGAPISPFVLIGTEASLEEQHACARRWATRAARGTAPLPARRRRPGPRIRIGYISGDFHAHATSYLTAELFERHDRSAFEIIGYSYGPDDCSEARRRVEAGFDRFVDLRLLASRPAAQRIQDDGIDILVDLKGYTRGARSDILAFRPAPVQVNYLGFPGTMGAEFVDYLIADAFTAPESVQAHCSERIVRLPDCFQPNDSQRRIAATAPSRAACGLPEDGFVFCAFNNAYKLTPRFLDIWARILKATPGSVLWLLAASPAMRRNLTQEAQARGIEPARLVFAERAGLADHLARCALADLFLDTLPVGAFTTASDALWAGLPILTCAGETPAGRGAGSLLMSFDLPELITATPEAYEAEAIRLAHDPVALATLRRKIVAGRATSPVFDTARFVRNLEDAYRGMAAATPAIRP